MSDLSLKVQRALFAKSNVAALVGAGKLSAIFESKAANTATIPYGIITRQASGPIERAFGPTRVLETDLYLLKVVADAGVSTSISPQAFADDMLVTWEATIGGALLLTGGSSVVWCERFSDMPPFEEPRGDGWIYHRGILLRIVSR